jgi:hypothetical protein
MAQSQNSGDGKERGISAVTQQYTGSFNLGPPVPSATAPIDINFATSASLLIDNSITRRHAVMTFDPVLRIKGQGTKQWNRGIGVNLMQMTGFMESAKLDRVAVRPCSPPLKPSLKSCRLVPSFPQCSPPSLFGTQVARA